MVSHLNLLDEGHTQVGYALILRSYCARTRAVRTVGRFLETCREGITVALRQRCWSALGH